MHRIMMGCTHTPERKSDLFDRLNVVCLLFLPFLLVPFRSYDGVVVSEIALADYITVNQQQRMQSYLPHSAGRYNVKRFRKATCPLVERLTNSLMMHGRNNGKKLLAVRIVQHAFEIIHLLTDKNPLQVLIDAVINSGPREDATRVGGAGTARRQAVDVSPLRRVNQAIYLLTQGVSASFLLSLPNRLPLLLLFSHFFDQMECMLIALSCTVICNQQARSAAFRNVKTIAECLANELINASKESSNSYAIKKKDEIERVAKSNR